MIGVSKLKMLTTQTFEPNDENYLLVQRYFEAYLKRLLFISIRLKGLQYKVAEELMSHTSYNLDITEQIKVVFSELLGVKYYNLKQKDSELKILEDCLIKYCRPIRNKLAHGAVNKLDSELLDVGIKITQEFVRRIEDYLINKRGKSAFDKPSEWGAKRVMQNKGVENYDLRRYHFNNVNKFNAQDILSELNNKSKII